MSNLFIDACEKKMAEYLTEYPNNLASGFSRGVQEADKVYLDHVACGPCSHNDALLDEQYGDALVEFKEYYDAKMQELCHNITAKEADYHFGNSNWFVLLEAQRRIEARRFKTSVTAFDDLSFSDRQYAREIYDAIVATMPSVQFVRYYYRDRPNVEACIDIPANASEEKFGPRLWDTIKNLSVRCGHLVWEWYDSKNQKWIKEVYYFIKDGEDLEAIKNPKIRIPGWLFFPNKELASNGLAKIHSASIQADLVSDDTVVYTTDLHRAEEVIKALGSNFVSDTSYDEGRKKRPWRREGRITLQTYSGVGAVNLLRAAGIRCDAMADGTLACDDLSIGEAILRSSRYGIDHVKINNV